MFSNPFDSTVSQPFHMGFPVLLVEEADRELQFKLSFLTIPYCGLYACSHLIPDEAFLITTEMQ